MSRSKETIAAGIVAAITIAIAVVVFFPTITSAAPVTGAGLPSITSVQADVRGGLHVFVVAFDDGAVCAIQRPLTATLAGVSAPVIGQVRSYTDTRIFFLGARMWGEVAFTDSAGNAHVGY